jgi:hypothetical protein
MKLKLWGSRILLHLLELKTMSLSRPPKWSVETVYSDCEQILIMAVFDSRNM